MEKSELALKCARGLSFPMCVGQVGGFSIKLRDFITGQPWRLACCVSFETWLACFMCVLSNACELLVAARAQNASRALYGTVLLKAPLENHDHSMLASMSEVSNPTDRAIGGKGPRWQKSPQALKTLH